MALRSRLSPTIDRFIAVQFFGPFLVCLAGFTATYMLGDLFDRFDELLRRGGLGLVGLEYFLFKLPLMVSQLLPVASLAGVLLGLALLNRSGEVLACQQLGISRLEMATPILCVALLISVFDFALSETIVPTATRKANYIYQIELQRRKIIGIFANRRIWVRVRDGFISAEKYDDKHRELRGINLYRLAADYSLRDIVRAKSAAWVGRGWLPDDVRALGVRPDGSVVAGSAGHFSLAVNPDDLSLLRMNPDEFSLWELNRYIRGLQREGLDPGGYFVDRDLKYAMPLACLIMVALGLTLNLDPLPRHSSLGRSFGLAIAIGFAYWVIFGLTSSLGRSDVLPAWLAAWIPNLTFAIVAVAIFLFGEER